ncbi:aminotransferase class I and II [Desulfofarcimen acetoxidans DSM 771]|uniref:Aminotransferase class I and II n=1 Tax=Desulfofarcimen acetoxidans (strain ATCC 49208 / DSM 771 / KCTC 5769 / VKM B-1644 / 5575) TaxID=485916 RepID=C8W6A6_DESAS|nr:pyridoxal phosphate-dependent aminotransferase [Desulfofarcimen acetoxidans]ACV62195.1 aminotransferase class I and II [Desulfofarcimen acetoxidans DSM 771]
MAISQKIEKFLANASFIRKMFEEGEQLRKIHGSDKVYDFTLGNPVNEPPKIFKEELKKLALEPVPGMHRYMSNAGYMETRQAVAQLLAEQSGLDFNEKHVVMTCGAGGALNVVLKTLLDPGDEVIILNPFFVEYKFYIDNHGGVFKEVATKEDFTLDLNAIDQAISEKTKAIILNSPNNPTGVIYSAQSLDSLEQVLSKKRKQYGHDTFVISDEPYAKIVYDGNQVPSIFKHITNSIAVTSHSKDLALPGERIGYLAINPLIDNIDLLIDGLIFCNRTLGFVNAPALMQRLVTHLQRESVDIEEYKEKRDLLYNHLTALGFEMVKPQGAFYLFPKNPIGDDMKFLETAKKFNILLVPGGGFGCPGYFRLAYCIDKQTIINSLPAFESLARELGMAVK